MRLFRACLPYVISLLSLPVSASDDCGEVDLRACLGAPRDQGETGWCFATTTADLTSCALGMRVSATDIALTYHLASPEIPGMHKDAEEAMRGPEQRARYQEWLTRGFPIKDSLEVGWNGKLPDYRGLYSLGGEEDIAFLAASARGFCLDSRLPSGPKHDVKNIAEAKRFSRSGFSPAPGQVLSHIPEEERAVAQAFWSWGDKKCGARIFPEQLFLPRSFEIAEDSVELLKLKKNAVEFEARRAELIRNINEHLTQGRAVASGIDTREMTTPEWSGDDPEHSIIIAGRKRIGGVCHYFVRNTGGADCKIYLPKLNPRKLCDAKAGGIWVPLEKIPSLYSAIAIEKMEGRKRGAPAGP